MEMKAVLTKRVRKRHVFGKLCALWNLRFVRKATIFQGEAFLRSRLLFDIELKSYVVCTAELADNSDSWNKKSLPLEDQLVRER